MSETVTQEAHRLVHGRRGDDYGHPFDDFSRTGRLWAEILGIPVTPEQVALCMAQVKVARLVASPDHHDSIVDVAGYMETYEMVLQRRAQLEQGEE